MPSRLLRKSQRLLIWLGVLPAMVAFSAFVTSSRHLASVRATEDSNVFLRRVDDLLAAVRDSETGQRGFLITGEERYLAPYSNARGTVESRLQELVHAGRQRGVSSAQLERLEALVEAKMKELNDTVALYREGQRGAALAQVKSDGGQVYMSEARAILHQIHAREDEILARDEVEERHRQQLLEVVLVIGMLLGIALAVIAYRLSLDYAHQRDQIEAHIQQTVREKTAELEQRTRELESRTAELQRSNADLTQYAYVSSHDLQEPLRTVASYVQLLARRYGDQLDDTAKAYIQFAVSGAIRMQTLINDLLQYSRVGMQGLELVETKFQEVVNTVLSSLKATVTESGAIVECGNLPVVLIDARKFEQVIQNLLSNAIKFRKPGIPPQIRIEARREGRGWTLSVQDNGIGFEEGYANRIFEIFQRLHGVGQYPGNGIGLAICRRIVELHGGRLWATSQPGTGSIFFFTVPDQNATSKRDSSG